MAIDKTIIDTVKVPVNKTDILMGKIKDGIAELERLAILYDKYNELTYKTCALIVDNEKINLEELIPAVDFKTFIIGILETRYNAIVKKVEILLEKLSNNLDK